MFLINDFVIMVWLVAIGWALWRKHDSSALIMAALYAFLAPVWVFPSGSKVNPSYLLTLLFFFYLLREWIQEGRAWWRHLHWKKPLGLYSLLFASYLLLATLGALLHGRAPVSAYLRAYLGQINIFALTFAFIYLFRKRSPRELWPILAWTGGIYLAVSAIFAYWQRIDFASSYLVSTQLYQTPDQQAPFLAMKAVERFERSFGAHYSPSVLGVVLLYFFAIILAYFVERMYHEPIKQRTSFIWRDRIGLALLAGILLLAHLGIFAFSKTVIIGFPIIYLYAMTLLPVILWLASKRHRSDRAYTERGSYRNCWTWAVPVLLILVVAYTLAWFTLPADQVGARHYYYGFILKPFYVLQTRYRETPLDLVVPLDPAVVDTVTSGITDSALEIWKQSKWVGVGFLPIAQEFLGDSQLASVLHNGGLLAFVLYLVAYTWIFIQALRQRSLLTLFLLPAIFFACLATNAFDFRAFAPFVALAWALPSVPKVTKYTKDEKGTDAAQAPLRAEQLSVRMSFEKEARSV